MIEPLGVFADRVGLGLGDFELSDITLEAAAGEHLGVLGPNGAGKSTLIRLLAGEMAPRSGRVLIGTEDVRSIPSTRLAGLRAVMGDASDRLLPQPVHTVVAMGRYPHRLNQDVSSADDAAAVERAMARADVTQIADRTHGSLSRGERARVAFARALAQETPILLLDEPAASLDIAHADLILSEARRVADSGGTVVSVIHDLNAAAYHCTSLCLLHEGRVVSSGTVEDVLTAEALGEVYEAKLRVVRHPFRDCPLVLLDG